MTCRTEAHRFGSACSVSIHLQGECAGNVGLGCVSGGEHEAYASGGSALVLEDGDECALSGCEGEAQPSLERPGEGIIGYVVESHYHEGKVTSVNS